MSNGLHDRQYWVEVTEKIATPVLENLAAGRLKLEMPIQYHHTVTRGDREGFTHLEAVGRLLCGIAPWFECELPEGDEKRVRDRLLEMALVGMKQIADPDLPDYLNFCQGHQPIVDAAFLCHALLRAPKALLGGMDDESKGKLAAALVASRGIRPHFNNWLLFSAMIEAGLHVLGEEADMMRVDYAVKQHDQWYKGDGVYGDGPDFHWDYYNSFVIQPMLLDVARTFSDDGQFDGNRYPVWLRRAQRYASVQESMISPEGTYPPLGRSLAYRFGAFQTLAQIALMDELPEFVEPAQVRCALTGVIRRQVEAPGTFDSAGWLRIGFCGDQPAIGERYISTGSLYLCAAGLLPLGLPPSHAFWSNPAADWTGKKAWAGLDLEVEHALREQ